MKYFLYARKSSESEDRQVLSIESQVKELKEFAQKNNLEIVKEFNESRTTKEPGRPVFNQMLIELEQGKADGIIAWHPDRCARNSIDGGKIIHLIDQKIIKDFRFPTYIYDNSPQGIFNLSLAFSFSKLYVDNLSQNVKRGIREKIRRGEYPGPAPLGYINNLKKHNIEVDPEKFEIVKDVIENFAYGLINIPGIQDKFFKLGIKTRTGLKMSYSSIRKILTSHFYYGVFQLKGELYPGSHPAMISKELFDKVQKRLAGYSKINNRSQQRKKEKAFLFDKLGKCGECGLSITREYHKKKSGKEFRYYRCSKKSRVCKCTQKAINENNLAPQIESLVDSIAIDDDLFDYSMQTIQEWRDEEHGQLGEQVETLKADLVKKKIQVDRLLDIYLEGSLNEEEYKIKKNKLIDQFALIQHKIDEIEAGASLWFEPLANALKVSNQGHHRVIQKDYCEIYKILKIIGLNRILFNQELSVELTKPFCFFSKVTSGLSTSPETNLQNKSQKTKLGSGVQQADDNKGLGASAAVCLN